MSQRPRVLVTRQLPQGTEERLQRDYDAILNRDDSLYDTETLLQKAEGCDALLPCPTDKLNGEVIDRLPESIKVIATFSVGYDHIDTAAAQRRGIVVTNTPDVLTDATADTTLLCLLGAARDAYRSQKKLRNRQWRIWSPCGERGQHVTGKRLGIFGMGRIGRAVAQRARGFQMDVHYYNLQRVPEEDAQGATYHADPESLLGVSDFISFHCPLTQDTHHFLNRERIAKLPDGAIVVNTSRGPVVEDEALIEALNSGKVAAAGLDVYQGEPNINPAYYEIENAYLLPHIGSATFETREEMGRLCCDNLDAVFSGQPAPARVV